MLYFISLYDIVVLFIFFNYQVGKIMDITIYLHFLWNRSFAILQLMLLLLRVMSKRLPKIRKVV